MSFALVHSVLLVAAIHVASLGADQFSFGWMRPPSSAIVVVIVEWMSDHSSEGSGSSSSSELELCEASSLD